MLGLPGHDISAVVKCITCGAEGTLSISLATVLALALREIPSSVKWPD